MIVETFLAGAMAAIPGPTDDFWFTNYPVRPGEADVSPNGALQVTAVMACVRVLAETIAQLPLHLMATDGRMRRRAIDQPLYDVLHDQPNDWQTSFEFREMMQGHLALRGNAYAQIVPGPSGAVDQLIPLHPDRMQAFRLENKRIGYLYRDRKGVPYRLTQDEVFHLRFMSLDDCVGMSVIAACRNAVELAQKLDQHGIWFFRNAARPSGAIKFPPDKFLTEEQHKLFRKSWREAYTGENLFTVALLEGGAEWEQLGLSNEDAQWLESKRKSVTEIAMMFRVQPHMIGSAIEHGHTYANVEQSDIASQKYTFMPWICRWEGAIKRDLIVQPPNAAERFYAKFGMEGLLRADSKTRVLFYEKMKNMGAYSVNEIRELEDLNPIKGGDEYKAASPPALPPPGKQDDDEPVGGDGASLVEPPGSPDHGAAEVMRWINEGFLLGESSKTEVRRSWIADAAERIAKVEIEALESRADKAAADREKFNAWAEQHWDGKVQEYIVQTLTPILAANNSPIDPIAVAASVCKTVVAQLTAGDPAAILARWKTERANVLTEIFTGDLCDE